MLTKTLVKKEASTNISSFIKLSKNDLYCWLNYNKVCSFINTKSNYIAIFSLLFSGFIFIIIFKNNKYIRVNLDLCLMALFVSLSVAFKIKFIVYHSILYSLDNIMYFNKISIIYNYSAILISMVLLVLDCDFIYVVASFYLIPCLSLLHFKLNSSKIFLFPYIPYIHYLDKKLLSEFLKPAIKGFLASASDTGLSNIARIFASNSLDIKLLPAFLVTSRIFESLMTFIFVPFHAVQPHLTFLLNTRKQGELYTKYLKTTRIICFLLFFSLLLIFSAKFLSDWIQFPLGFLDLNLIALYSFFVVLSSFVVCVGYIHSVANKVPFLSLIVVSFCISTILFYIDSYLTIQKIIFYVFIPKLVLINLLPGILGSKYFNVSPSYYITKVSLPFFPIIFILFLIQ